jgi:hypothetical protein
MVPTTLWWAETNHPGNNRSEKQIKTQNKAICFFFIFKQQMFTSTIMGSNRCHDHFDLFALAQRAPDDLHSHENDEKSMNEKKISSSFSM